MRPLSGKNNKEGYFWVGRIKAKIIGRRNLLKGFMGLLRLELVLSLWPGVVGKSLGG